MFGMLATITPPGFSIFMTASHDRPRVREMFQHVQAKNGVEFTLLAGDPIKEARILEVAAVGCIDFGQAVVGREVHHHGVASTLCPFQIDYARSDTAPDIQNRLGAIRNEIKNLRPRTIMIAFAVVRFVVHDISQIRCVLNN
jgi:hypothetical protein